MRRIFPLLLSLVLFASCNDEEDALPSYTQDLADIVTNWQGRAVRMVFDNGESKTIANEVSGLVNDTTYRVRALYTVEDDKVWLTNYSSVLTVEVAKYKEESVITDPVSVVACWQGGNYINLRLSLKGTTKGVHYFGFHQTGDVENPDGSHTLQVVLLHDQNNDPLYYSLEDYLSLPLRPLDSTLTAGRDSIRITIQTFDGTRDFTFCQNTEL